MNGITEYYGDACKNNSNSNNGERGGNNHIFTGVMTFVMGIVTMVRMTRNMPRKLTDSSSYGVDATMIQAPSEYQTLISTGDYFTMLKRMAELEEKMNVMTNMPPLMPPEKEEMLQNALNRVDFLEQELSSAKKVKLTNNFTHIHIHVYCFSLFPLMKFFTCILCSLLMMPWSGRKSSWPILRRKRRRRSFSHSKC